MPIARRELSESCAGRGLMSRSPRSHHVRLIARIVLAEILLDFLPCHPCERPRARPRPRVGSWIVHRHLVAQRVAIRAREFFGQAKALGMWQAAVREPEALVERIRFNNQGVAFP